MANSSSRRAFFNSLLGGSNQKAVNSLDEHTTPLDLADVYHLLRRCCFSVDDAFAKTLVGKSAKEAVNLLISNATSLSKPVPNFDINQGFNNPDLLGGGSPAYHEKRTFNLETHFAQNDILKDWWVNLMKADTKSLSEKVTFMWHGHFTTQYEGNEPIAAQWIYRQNELYRTLFLPNFKLFLEKVTVDGAMLMYLNGSENVREAPNENYARELFELFSIGIDDGNYTEDDIREAAKVLTGWKASHFIEDHNLYKPYFNSGNYSTEDKEVFGVKFTVDYEVTKDNVYKNAIEKLSSVILEQKGEAVSKFMATNFYNYFVYSKPITEENGIINELAEHFRASGFNLKEMLIKLLTSKHFFDINNRGIQIKNHLENLISFSYHFGIETNQLNKWSKEFGLEPLNPPNVSGWTGYRNWITTKTLPAYIHEFSKIITAKTNLEMGEWAAKNDGFFESRTLVEDISFKLLAKLPNSERIEKLENVLLGGAPYYEWPEIAQNKENAGLRVKALLKAMFKLPDFYLN